MMFDGLPRNHYQVIYADPPWRFATWNKATAVKSRKNKSTFASANVHYSTMTTIEICRLPVWELAAENCVLFMWVSWPMLKDALKLIEAWGFEYKTCGFDWTKANGTQADMFKEEMKGAMGMGYWTRANTEPCLIATKGKPKRLKADVRMSIIEPRREHSRKPSRVHADIERLVPGPYLELFGRQQRKGWTIWGNQSDKFDEAAA
jgi:N6-adenosine-specific RNA methylase IME4